MRAASENYVLSEPNTIKYKDYNEVDGNSSEAMTNVPSEAAVTVGNGVAPSLLSVSYLMSFYIDEKMLYAMR